MEASVEVNQLPVEPSDEVPILPDMLILVCERP